MVRCLSFGVILGYVLRESEHGRCCDDEVDERGHSRSRFHPQGRLW